MDALIFLQEDIYDRISRNFSNFKKSPKERITVDYIKTKVEQLENLWLQFRQTHKDIITSSDDVKIVKASPYIKNDFYTQTEDVYEEYKGLLKTKLASCNVVSAVVDVSEDSLKSRKNVKLPALTIPTFSGKYTEWTTFKDLFLNHVDKADIPDVEKMQYLKGLLSGEPEQMVRNIPIASDNYKRCWSLLEEFYSNKRYISHQILRRLFGQKSVQSGIGTGLRELIHTTSECLGALSNLGVDVSSWDLMVIHMLSPKLDPESRQAWELNITQADTDELPTLNQFNAFLKGRYRAWEVLDSEAKEKKPSSNRVKSFHVANKPENNNKKCKFCQETHYTSQCKKFIDLNLVDRRSFVEKHKLCFNCLGANHSVKQCRIRITCHTCGRKHHSLLHMNSNGSSSTLQDGGEGSSAKDEAKSSASVACFSSQHEVSGQVLLATALVRAETKSGGSHVIRALLDQGSQASFVTEATAQYLGLKRIAAKGLISGLGQCKNICSKYVADISLTSLYNKGGKLNVRVHILPQITSLLPGRRFVEKDWVSDLPLADPQYYIPNKIDILLGAEVFGQIIEEGIRKDRDNGLVAQNTSLGWVLSGVAAKAGDENIVVMHASVQHYNEENEQLKKFWEIEAEPNHNKKHILTEEEMRCEKFFSETTTRDEDGRYVVRLPFKTEEPEIKIKNSKKIAEKRLKLLKTRLNKASTLEADYKEVIKEYLTLNHMEKIPKEEINKSSVYLPHFAVLRDDKETTKVRVVFDASCKGENGVSLNDLMMVGPTLQPDLRHLLLRWRSHKICLSADIVKMYRQIKVAGEDVDCQRILWQEAENDIEEFRLLRVTFGTASAPYLAVKALQQVAIDEGENYPMAAEIIKKDFHMDDLLTGCETVENGIKIFNEINELLGKAGFTLQKWSTNNEELLDKLKGMKHGIGNNGELKLKMDEVMKLLGLTWNRTEDAFQYTVTLPEMKEPVTKRVIISDIARLFDPLGWVAPSVIVAKIIIQKLWLSGVGWDDEVSKKIYEEWVTYRNELVHLQSLKIPRWIYTGSTAKLIELHGFCDASKAAYAAVVYVRIVDAENNVNTTLIAAKTKVAPIKQISIPRLELCGAVLLCRLLLEVAEIMQIPSQHIYAWTDSTVVLAWLSSHPNRWQTFVANRVSEILTSFNTNQWCHVRSKSNPADCASRGLKSSELVNNSLWFNGPDFLRNQIVSSIKLDNIDTDLEEIKKVHIVVEEDKFWERFSSLNRLVRVVAYCRRVLNWKIRKDRQSIDSLEVDELKEALEVCIRKVQEESFKEEIDSIKKLENLAIIKGPLKTLNPFIDSNSILRVGGRLEKSMLNEDRKHPILLPKKSIFTDLVVADAHSKTLHGGPQLMLTYLRSKYWIVGVKQLVKTCVRKCVTCVRYNAKVSRQLMGQLPSSRVTQARPFKSSGVDYAGPIQIRSAKGRGQHASKGYICLFVCMATKAIHLEVVTDLTSEGFLAAFKRFVSRRGHCSEVWSDNGTTFVGAAKQLTSLFSSESVAETLAIQGTKWHFIPPHAPNFGGLWEAGVKSVKHHLKRVIGDSTLTYEELSTVLAQIEACLNSRPIAQLDNDDGEVITPGHFLVGEPLLTVPDYNYESSNIGTLRRWQLTQRMMQSFWRRWSHDYLTSFLQRHKWSVQTPEPEVGQVCLVKEDDLPPSRWLLGRVVAKHPGTDQITRVVSLKTKNNVIKRPVSKICILPVATD